MAFFCKKILMVKAEQVEAFDLPVETEDGVVTAYIGDWIVKYPDKPNGTKGSYEVYSDADFTLNFCEVNKYVYIEFVNKFVNKFDEVL